MIINGEAKDLKEGITIEEMLHTLNLDPNRVVVEVNFEIIAKEAYTEFILNKEDKVEIVGFVGGG